MREIKKTELIQVKKKKKREKEEVQRKTRKKVKRMHYRETNVFFNVPHEGYHDVYAFSCCVKKKTSRHQIEECQKLETLPTKKIQQ